MNIESLQPDGSRVSGTSHVGQRLQAETEMLFAHLPESRAGKSLFDPAGLLAMLRLLGVFDVGVDRNGNRLEVPQYLLDAIEQSSPK